MTDHRRILIMSASAHDCAVDAVRLVYGDDIIPEHHSCGLADTAWAAFSLCLNSEDPAVCACWLRLAANCLRTLAVDHHSLDSLCLAAMAYCAAAQMGESMADNELTQIPDSGAAALRTENSRIAETITAMARHADECARHAAGIADDLGILATALPSYHDRAAKAQMYATACAHTHNAQIGAEICRNAEDVAAAAESVRHAAECLRRVALDNDRPYALRIVSAALQSIPNPLDKPAQA